MENGFLMGMTIEEMEAEIAAYKAEEKSLSARIKWYTFDAVVPERLQTAFKYGHIGHVEIAAMYPEVYAEV